MSNDSLDPLGHKDCSPHPILITSLIPTLDKSKTLVDDDNVFYEIILAAPTLVNSRIQYTLEIGMLKGESQEDASSVDIHESEIENDLRSNLSTINGEELKDADFTNEEISEGESLTRRKRGRPLGSKNKLSPTHKKYNWKVRIPKCFNSFKADKNEK